MLTILLESFSSMVKNHSCSSSIMILNLHRKRLGRVRHDSGVKKAPHFIGLNMSIAEPTGQVKLINSE